MTLTARLMSNANKFTEKGTITIDASQRQQNGRDWITLAMTDTGIGMTAEQMGKLFQEFSQASSTTASKYGGHGPWPRDKSALLSDDGRRHRGRERTRPRLDLHDPTAENCRSSEARSGPGLINPSRPTGGDMKSPAGPRFAAMHESVLDPSATLSVHCGNGFDARFEPYQSTRLSRYNAAP
jgi:Histidine kinase-, DNA gyrase B-, and HSP90-like ATPase